MKNFLLSGFEDFIMGNGIWILVGCLAFFLLVSILFLILNIEKEKRMRNKSIAPIIPIVEEEKPVERIKPIEVKVSEKEETTEEVKSEEKIKEKTETKKPAKKPAAKKVEKKVVEEEVESEENGNYEISYDAEEREWLVKRENSSRATKRTKTKQEAIDYAKPLAEKHEVKLIVHTKNN